MSHSPRGDLLRAAVAAFGADKIPWPLTVRVQGGNGVGASWRFTEDEWRAMLADEVGETGPLSELEEDALEGADRIWRTSADLAGRTGVEYTGHWRSAVAELVRRGFLERQRGTRRLRRTETPHERPEDADRN